LIDVCLRFGMVYVLRVSEKVPKMVVSTMARMNMATRISRSVKPDRCISFILPMILIGY